VTWCYKLYQTPSENGHYYKQLDLNLLHIANMELINLVHNSNVDNKNLVVIANTEFDVAIKVTIFNLEIYKYCTSTNFNKN
jgi:hypothetical protein